ncbi:MFS transporter [Nostoc punctiforme]|uniref:Antibiotic efflux protein n=1 Tax=Nostoc punctiforme (strain ATCC 29133 / PCC 73102) TaxID=63737 RepID=B2J4X4_NOSP7|nr:MFS transporter [Nostoc punctiforme]ACC80634.1 antibiotic efflux protein [Nostoc punctiforme PCC 73102]
MTSDPSHVAALSAVLTLSWPIFALPGGIISDRRDRKWLMVWANIARAVAMVLLALAATTEDLTIWTLYAIAFGLGASETLADTAGMAIVPAVVKRSRLRLN